MKWTGWGIVAVSFLFLGVIAPGFYDGFAAGSGRIGILGWTLIALFLTMFVSGVWLALSKKF